MRHLGIFQRPRLHVDPDAVLCVPSIGLTCPPSKIGALPSGVQVEKDALPQFISEWSPETELQKRANRANQFVLIFSGRC